MAVEWASVLSLTILSFIANSTVLTFYFSGILSHSAMKQAPIKEGFLLSLSGSTVGSASSLAFTYLPSNLPLMDFAIALVLMTWVLLIHHRYDEGWLETVVVAIIGCVIYAVILAITSSLLILWISVG